MYESLVGRVITLVEPINLLSKLTKECYIATLLPEGTEATILKVVLHPEPKLYIKVRAEADFELRCWIDRKSAKLVEPGTTGEYPQWKRTP